SEPGADADRGVASAMDVDGAMGALATSDLASWRQRVGDDDVAVLVQQVADVEERVPSVGKCIAAGQVRVPVLAEPRWRGGAVLVIGPYGIEVQPGRAVLPGHRERAQLVRRPYQRHLRFVDHE